MSTEKKEYRFRNRKYQARTSTGHRRKRTYFYLFVPGIWQKAGYRPLVLERGEQASRRKETVDHFWKNGVLNPDSNVQFGEGGAGTFLTEAEYSGQGSKRTKP